VAGMRLSSAIAAGIGVGLAILARYRRNLWMSPWHENAAYLPP
jgi:hypothetical protein